MPLSNIALKPAPIERPSCPNCGSLMWLTRLMPDGTGWDQRTFECGACGHEVIKICRGVLPLHSWQ
jgi:predicted RNA-binding Zn-ribbon protein involved in translation (DUF1610 family)